LNVYILPDRPPGHPSFIAFVNAREGAISELVSMTKRQGRVVATVRAKVNTARHAGRRVSYAFVFPLDDPLG
jgi:hypothetical protein